MSRNGPNLRRCPKGYAYAKFNGRKINFGRFDDPDAQGRFDSFRARWLLNDRELPVDGSPEQTTAYSVQELCDGFLGHLHKRHDRQWLVNNLSPSYPKTRTTLFENQLASGAHSRDLRAYNYERAPETLADR